MRKIIVPSVLGFILLVFLNSSILITDYRDVYVGKYFCKSTCNYKDGDTRKLSYISDTISIIVSKDVVDSVLQIKLNNRILKVKLFYKNFNAYQLGEHYGGVFFAADSLDFFFVQGRAFSYKYIGKKK